MTPVKGAGLGRYLKEAFLFRWNLLLFLGGAAAAAIGPFPDVFLPIVGALELLYLGALTSLPRFRAAIDARAREALRASPEGSPALADLLAALEPAARARFERLRARCLDMQRLARGVRGQSSADASDADPIRTPALDRLLWAFLRLLGAQQALQRFLSASDEAGLRRSLQDLRAKQAQAEARKDERLTRALADAVATGEQRLANYAKAASNAEFLSVELDRIEGKIQAVAEMAVSHQDADQISSQVDAVAASMAHTEQAIREIDQITGLGDHLSEPPPILAAGVERERS
ncbi:MAG TPA: hypothetical protein VFL83_01300 [Anaeromyxobacter sp.]|nr:hypothetical protein [Anaeromyxobacter sp.]